MAKISEFLKENKKMLIIGGLALGAFLFYVNSDANRKRIAKKIAQRDYDLIKGNKEPSWIPEIADKYYLLNTTDLALIEEMKDGESYKGVKDWSFFKVLTYTFK